MISSGCSKSTRLASAAASFAPPTLALHQNGNQVELHFIWPAYYISRFSFGVRHSSALDQPFVNLAVSAPISVAGDQFKITFTAPATTDHFYYLTVALE